MWITAFIVEVEIFINENFSIKIALCYERNSPLDVSTYAFGQGGCAPSFRPFCTIFLKPREAAANSLSFATASSFFPWHYIAVLAEVFKYLCNTFACFAVNLKNIPAAGKLQPSSGLRQIRIRTVDLCDNAYDTSVAYRRNCRRV